MLAGDIVERDDDNDGSPVQEVVPAAERRRSKNKKSVWKSTRKQEQEQEQVPKGKEALEKMMSSSKDQTPPLQGVHFPCARDQEVDPLDEDFFEKLHEKYFADLPREPEKMAWMQPVSDQQDKLEYAIDAESLLPVELRFGFKGELLGPKESRKVPTNVGLHHHSDAPSVAGYTIPELAHLARSTVPGQRCLAIRTIGRILFCAGDEQCRYGTEISNAIWEMIHELLIIQTLTQATENRHLGVKNYAIEALWLWKQGGGHTVNESAV